MYTLKKDTPITAQVILDVIAYNETLKPRYDKLEGYYIGQHAILNREKVDALSNNKVLINHPKYIVDTNFGYLMGNPVEYQVTEGLDIQPLLDQYKKQTINELDSEIVKDTGIFGLQYEYVYVNEDAEPRSAEIDNRNAVLVHDTTLEHKKLFGIIYRPVKKGETLEYYDVVYCDVKVTREYKLKNGELSQKGKDTPHQFGDVPMICYKNNPDYLGDFEPVISLVDAVNILTSDRLNDKEQLVDAILCLINMDFTDEQVEQLKRYRVLANIPPDGDVKYLIKTLNEADIEILKKSLVEDIHKIAMVPNMSDNNFIGNSSGVAIRYKLLAFEQSIQNKERWIEKGLMERFKLYNHFLNVSSKMDIIPIEDVDAVFKHNLPSNDFEISQMINNLDGFVDKETLVSQLSFIKDAKEVVEMAETGEGETPKPSYDDSYANNEMPDANTVIPNENADIE